jgi:aminoglycoside phosphotransferase (APT) family kinase protein
MSKNQNGKEAEYQKYLTEQQGKIGSTPQFIDSVVSKATGSRIKNNKRLMVGETNEVYDVQTEENQSVIVRVAHYDWGSFKKEKWAFEESGKKGVPVPKVLLVEDSTDGGKFTSVCVLSKLPGHPLDQREVTSPDEDRKYLSGIIRKAGSILSKLHQVETIGFGEINENGQGEFETFYDSLVSSLLDTERLDKVITHNNLPPNLFNKAMQILKSHQDILTAIKPHLLHGDYGPKHIMVDGDQITGILDFGNARSGDPALDFAWWDSWYNDQTPTKWLMEGYENKDIFGSDFEDRFQLSKISINIDLLVYYDEGGFKSGVEIAKNNLLTAINYFLKK